MVLEPSSNLSIPGSDINGDGHSDILWQNSLSGRASIGYLDNLTQTHGSALPTLSPLWTRVAVADFTQDGQSDLLLHHSITGNLVVGRLDQDTNLVESFSVGKLTASQRVVGVGQFNQEASPDLLIANQTTGALEVWYMDGPSRLGNSVTITTRSPLWQVKATGDFNHDGYDDLVWSNQKTGQAEIWLMEGLEQLGAAVKLPTASPLWELRGSGDFDNNGHTDLLWAHKPSGNAVAWLMQGTTYQDRQSVKGMGAQWQPLALARGGLADLVLEQAIANLSEGDDNSLSIGASLTNQGSKTSLPSRLKYYLSTDETLGEEDTFLGDIQVSSLRAGQTFSFESDLDYNPAWGTGTRYILFAADTDAVVLESNETNNQLSASFIASEGQPQNIDLKVHTPIIPESVVAGEEITLKATASNAGTVAAPASTLSVYLSDTYNQDNTLPSNRIELISSRLSELAAGDEIEETLTFIYQESYGDGLKYLYFVTDSGLEVSEVDEDNNVLVKEIEVTPAPKADLVVQNPTVSSTTAFAGKEIELTAQVQNIGQIGAEASTLKFYISDDDKWDAGDTKLGSKTIPAIAGVSSSVPQSFSFTYSPTYGTGTKYVLFVADADDEVFEREEDNNVSAIPLIVKEVKLGRDLVIETPSISDSTITVGQSITVGATVQNQGADPTQPSNLGIYVSTDSTWDSTDQLITTLDVASLETYDDDPESFTFNYLAGYGVGARYLLFVADSEGAIAESNETNNLASLAIEVTEDKPDLTISNLTIDDPITDAIIGSYSLKNLGSAAVSQQFAVYYFVSNQLITDKANIITSGPSQNSWYLGQYDSLSLPEGGSEQNDIGLSYNRFTLGTGTRYILVVADYLDKISESDETNNIKAFQVQVQSIAS